MNPLSIRAACGALLLLPVLAACGGDDADASNDTPAPVARLAIGGGVDRPAPVTAADLRTLPVVTQTVTYSSGSGNQTRTYSGASLWAVIDAAGIKVDAAKKNDVLGKYVIASATDGYRALFSLGEIKPDFGGKASLVAYAETRAGVSGDLTAADAPFRITAPADVKGGRYVSMATQLDVRASGSTKTGTGGGIAPSFTISGAVLRPGTFNLAALQALPAVSRPVGTATYTGVDLWYLLNTVVGLKVPADAKNPTLTMYAVATGSDGYQALLSLGEVDPGFGNEPNLIAYSVDGAPLNTNGMARLVVPTDAKGGRAVSNLIDLEVFVAP